MSTDHDAKVDALFDGYAEARRLFEVVRKFVESLGPVSVEGMKTQVSFGARRTFAWVWLPQIWTSKRPETSITLTFSLKHQVDDERIAESMESKPGVWTHHVVIEHEREFDDAVRGWIREAYASGNSGSARRYRQA